MKSNNYLMLLLLTSIIFISCSSSQETATNEEKKEPEIYVFDVVNKKDTTKIEIPKETEAKQEALKIDNKSVTELKELSTSSTKKFIIQVGVFSTKERAQNFVKENQDKIAYILNISLRETDNYYVVRLYPFQSREDAEKVKKNIMQIQTFKDAFIITNE